MSAAMYEAIAFALRYWFIFVVVGLLIAMVAISVREVREKRHALSEIDQYVGYLEIVSGPKSFIGDRFGLREFNQIGSGGRADIMIPAAGVAKKHATVYSKDDMIVLQPGAGCAAQINGRRAVNAHALKTGDVISMGDVDLRVYLKKKRLRDDS